jgi:hypothetical protein
LNGLMTAMTSFMEMIPLWWAFGRGRASDEGRSRHSGTRPGQREFKPCANCESRRIY